MKGLFIGLNTIDIHFLVDHYPGKNEKIKAKKFEFFTGGPATNAAITFAHLGGKASLVSLIGNHQLKTKVTEELTGYQIELTDLVADRVCDPVFASIITSKDSGERSVISYHPKNHHKYGLIPDHLQPDKFDIILTDGFYPEAAVALIKRAKGKVPVILDGGSWKTGLDFLLPMIEIAICSADFYPPGSRNITETIDYLNRRGIKKTIITRGEKPVMVKEENEFYEIPVKTVKASDTMGAGDIFHGAFCYYYLESHQIKQAVSMASKIAAKSCMSFGSRKWMEE